MGDGTTTDRSTPVKIMSGVQTFATGWGGDSLFLKNDGTVWAVGSNGYGQLGDGTATARSTPVKVMSGVQAIATGAYHSLFLKNDGTAWAVGDNASGQAERRLSGALRLRSPAW
ncbi:hypothetical protein Ga0100230_002035 [Opitutaceae bacterium TAV3]|nr:hypothetical protein Ga0100230_002035 [Opitutaceae bacterium TAV3]